MKKLLIFLILISLPLLSLFCKTYIVGYEPGDCVMDYSDKKCKEICGWELSYILHSREDCMRAKFNCPEGERLFGNWRGCGCARPVFCQ